MTQLLDGKVLSNDIAERLKALISSLETKPHLSIIQVGDDVRSNAYIKRKITYGQNIGAIVTHQKYSEDITESELEVQIEKLNANNNVHGIIIQLPIPEHLNRERITDMIDSEKDIDGLTRNSPFAPATARGILSLLKHYEIAIKDKRIVVVGRSLLVGKPTALLLEKEGGLVSIAHRGTTNLAEVTREVDILVVATGVLGLINRNHVSPNQTIIDVGINLDKNDRLVGDVVFEEVSSIVKAITPVPGGVGPMTVASLFENLLDAYRGQTN